MFSDATTAKFHRGQRRIGREWAGLHIRRALLSMGCENLKQPAEGSGSRETRSPESTKRPELPVGQSPKVGLRGWHCVPEVAGL